MRIALISGLWPSRDNNGFDSLRDILAESGHEVRIFKYTDKINSAFDVVCAHSFGANLAVEQNCQYMALIEPVRFWWSQKPWDVSCPTDCFLRKGWRLPPSVGCSNVTNQYISGLDHGNAPRNEFIRATILSSIRTL